jgi:hypothetical protein
VRILVTLTFAAATSSAGLEHPAEIARAAIGIRSLSLRIFEVLYFLNESMIDGGSLSHKTNEAANNSYIRAPALLALRR